jgi:hypothetical protein
MRNKMKLKDMKKIKATHEELAKELGVALQTVRGYRLTVPKKLNLMLDGIRHRKLLRQLREQEIKDAKKADK